MPTPLFGRKQSQSLQHMYEQQIQGKSHISTPRLYQRAAALLGVTSRPSSTYSSMAEVQQRKMQGVN